MNLFNATEKILFIKPNKLEGVRKILSFGVSSMKKMEEATIR